MIKVYYGDELYHHGVKGQKWGDRNGPPYPLSPSQHSASEKKAGWRRSLSDKRTAARNARSEAARTYNKRYDESIKRANAADEKWADVKTQYKALGKNAFQRIKAVRDAEKGKGTDAAKKYLNDWDEAERMSNDADSHWNETKDYYKKSGRNPIERISNVATDGKGVGNILKEKWDGLSDRQKTAIKIGTAAAATGLALYAAYKISDMTNEHKAVKAGRAAYAQTISDRKTLQNLVKSGEKLRGGSNASYRQNYSVGNQHYEWTNYKNHPELMPEHLKNGSNKLLERSVFTGETPDEAYKRAYNNIRRKKKRI